MFQHATHVRCEGLIVVSAKLTARKRRCAQHARTKCAKLLARLKFEPCSTVRPYRIPLSFSHSHSATTINATAVCEFGSRRYYTTRHSR